MRRREGTGRLRAARGAAWLLATSAAVALSWFGVHTVVAGTAYDPPQALAVRGHDDGERVSSTHRPRPPSSPAATPEGGRGAGNPSTGQGRLHSARAPGGRAVFDLGGEAASLVSATPNKGWTMRIDQQDRRIEVVFTRGARTSSVVCHWGEGPATVRESGG